MKIKSLTLLACLIPGLALGQVIVPAPVLPYTCLSGCTINSQNQITNTAPYSAAQAQSDLSSMFMSAAGVNSAITNALPQAVTALSITALASGKVQVAATRSDGSVLSSTTPQAVNGAAVAAYDPTIFPITNGGTAVLDSGYNYYYFSGTGIIAGYTIKLPPTPGDGQLARLVLPSGLTITALTVQDATGNAVTCTSCTSVLFGSGPVFQFRASVGWTQVSKG